MRMAPMDIAQKTFNRKIMGYDQDEVMDFLKKVAGELEKWINERNMLREVIKEKELSIIEYKERDELLKKTISTATKMAERMHTDSGREAKLILDSASQKAEVITQKAKKSLKDIHNEITYLKKIRLQFENNLQSLIQSHLSMLEQGKKVMPNPVISEFEGEMRVKSSPPKEKSENYMEDKDIKALDTSL